jgi:hypothetical protein
LDTDLTQLGNELEVDYIFNDIIDELLTNVANKTMQERTAKKNKQQLLLENLKEIRNSKD